MHIFSVVHTNLFLSIESVYSPMHKLIGQLIHLYLSVQTDRQYMTMSICLPMFLDPGMPSSLPLMLDSIFEILSEIHSLIEVLQISRYGWNTPKVLKCVAHFTVQSTVFNRHMSRLIQSCCNHSHLRKRQQKSNE